MRKKSLLAWSLCILMIGLIGGCYFQFFCKPSYIKLPVYYLSCSDLPLVDVEIDKKKYRLEWDSGSAQYICLRKEILDQIQSKKENGVWEFYDLKGNLYTEPQFIIPYISFNHHKFQPLIAIQDSEVFKVQGSQIGESDPQDRICEFLKNIHGSIGMKMFKDLCLFFDLPNSLIYIAKDKASLEKKGIFLPQNFVEIPFAGETNAIIVINTERGRKRVVLDTGSSLSILKEPELPELKMFTIEHLVIEGVNFGSQDFGVYNFSDQYSEFEGILGIDFFKKHQVFLDLKNQRAFINPSDL